MNQTNNNSISDVIQSHNRKFASLMHSLGARNTRGTKRHELEVEFAHALHEIQNAPPYILPNLLGRLTVLISKATREVQALSDGRR